MTDQERLDFLDSIIDRKDSMSIRVGTDAHITHNIVSIYMRDRFGRVEFQGHGTTWRKTIDDLYREVTESTHSSCQ